MDPPLPSPAPAQHAPRPHMTPLDPASPDDSTPWKPEWPKGSAQGAPSDQQGGRIQEGTGRRARTDLPGRRWQGRGSEVVEDGTLADRSVVEHIHERRIRLICTVNVACIKSKQSTAQAFPAVLLLRTLTVHRPAAVQKDELTGRNQPLYGALHFGCLRFEPDLEVCLRLHR